LSYMSFGLFQPVDWLGRTDTALWAILVMSVWQGVGFHMVIWLSGLQTISPDLYEAADIEGASRWQKFSMITWPLLRNTAVLIIIVITMQAFALFAQIDVMTKGGPRDSTQSIVYQAVERGYRQQDIAAGSAISVVLFLLVLCISLTQRYLTREKQ
jgi:multiple sugar transport system permease protein